MSNALKLMEVNGHQARIMVVDDDAMLRALIRVRLKKHGYAILEASDGQQALEQYPIEHPDIILMDANMPGVDGFEATRLIKKQYPEAANTPILMVSGLEDDESVDKAFSTGATEYITKPICWPLLTHRLRNICTAMQVEASILKATDDAIKANQSKSEFLANMSHELRTPMHAILSFATMGCDKVSTAPEEKLARYFSRIEESGNRLLVLLNDLLDLSKLESGVIDLNIQPSDLSKLVNTVLLEMEALIRSRGISIEVMAPEKEQDLAVLVDDEKMIQVIRNLLSNSVKFTPEGKKIFIRFEDSVISNQKDDTKIPALALLVEDQGVGIPKDELETVFDKFVQSSKTKTGAGGTGLGLAICKEIVEGHGGQIVATCNEFGGATFRFKVPKV